MSTWHPKSSSNNTAAANQLLIRCKMPSLVLIHGFNGHHVKSWMFEDKFWPEDLLPSKRPNTRVLSMGYEAEIRGGTSTATIRTIATNLLIFLELSRTGVEWTRPIVFVAHSLGGLIVKQVCLSVPSPIFAAWTGRKTSVCRRFWPHFSCNPLCGLSE